MGSAGHIRRDCFACEKGECAALKEQLCRVGPCPFFKSKMKAKAERDRAYWAALGKGYYADGGSYVPKNYGEGRR